MAWAVLRSISQVLWVLLRSVWCFSHDEIGVKCHFHPILSRVHASAWLVFHLFWNMLRNRKTLKGSKLKNKLKDSGRERMKFLAWVHMANKYPGQDSNFILTLTSAFLLSLHQVVMDMKEQMSVTFQPGVGWGCMSGFSRANCAQIFRDSWTVAWTGHGGSIYTVAIVTCFNSESFSNFHFFLGSQFLNNQVYHRLSIVYVLFCFQTWTILFYFQLYRLKRKKIYINLIHFTFSQKN